MILINRYAYLSSFEIVRVVSQLVFFTFSVGAVELHKHVGICARVSFIGCFNCYYVWNVLVKQRRREFLK